MCRLFGFRSIIPSQVHSSLVGAENALMIQSQRHPDGWGVAYYEAGAPHVVKSVATAMDDHLFQKVSGIVSSETVVAHVRKATIGDNSIINSHPFQYGQWIFAHNGNIQNFDKFKDQLISHVHPHLKRFVLGDTDSEVIFYLILSQLKSKDEFDSGELALEDLVSSAKDAIQLICGIVGPFRPDESPTPTDDTYLTFLMTNGKTMIAHQGGKKLFYSTHKKRCPERDTCPSFHQRCETKAKDGGKVSHLLFSSEPLIGQNIWEEMTPGQVLGANDKMTLTVF